jgi:hypothetical protein
MRSTFSAAMLFTLLLGCSISGLAASGVRDEFKVTEVFLKADDGRPIGACPVRVTFRGYITASGPGSIKYTFTRSDGATGPVHIMEFKKAGTQPITTSWTLGDSRVLPRYAGWQAVKVLSPVEIESNHDTGSFEINCSGTTAVQTNPNQRGESEQPSSEMQAIIPHPIYGRSTAPIKLKPNQTALLELKNTGKESVQVRIQFVDKDDQLIEQRDVTIAAGATEATEFTGPNYPLRNPKGLGDLLFRAAVQTQVEPNGFLEPTLRIIENKSGNIISVIGPARFNPKGPHANPENSDRQLGPLVVPPDAPPESGAKLAATYESMLSQITAPNLDKFNKGSSKLKSLNEELSARFDRAPKSANFDKQTLQEEFKTILQEKDRTKLDQRIAEFQNRYEQQFMQQLQAAGIDISTERQRMASLIGLEQQRVTPEAYLNAHRMLAVGTESEFVDDRPPVEAAPLFYEDVVAPPFIEAGTRGSGAANGRDGTIRSSAVSPVSVGSTHQSLSSLTQGLTTRPGARRLHVSVPINDLDVYMRVGAFVGDASAEFAITLRVFDGAREVAKRRVPVQRLAAAYIGFDSFNRRFPPITLGCEFERSSTSVVGTYLMVIEFETLAGSQGFGEATSSASGRVGPFTVRTY